MSKSLGNFKTMREIFEQYDPMVVRYMILSAHYKAPIDFSKDNLEQAKNSLDRIQEFVLNSKESKKEMDKELLESTKEDFIKYMDDDFDTPKALAVIFNLVKEANIKGGGKKVHKLMLEFDEILNIFEKEIRDDILLKEVIENHILIKDAEGFVRRVVKWIK